MIKVERKGKFEEMLEDLVASDPESIDFVTARIKIFAKNPDDTRLSNHPLTGRLDGKFAFSISDDIRIVYEWIGKSTVRFLSIGHHKRVSF